MFGVEQARPQVLSLEGAKVFVPANCHFETFQKVQSFTVRYMTSSFILPIHKLPRPKPGVRLKSGPDTSSCSKHASRLRMSYVLQICNVLLYYAAEMHFKGGFSSH